MVRIQLKTLTPIMITIIMMTLACEKAKAVYKVVVDPRTIAAVTENTASQGAIENLHNKRLDSIASKQQKIEQYTAIMATITEAYKYTLQNIKGFGQESKYYVEIGLCSYEIVNRVPNVLNAIKKSNLPGKTMCVKELVGIVAKTQQLVKDFIDIVNNGKIENPLGKNEKGSGDGYNFLDRYDRLTVANRIYTDLLGIRYKMEMFEMMASYANWSQVFLAYDPIGWATVMSGINRVNMVISMWKGL